MSVIKISLNADPVALDIYRELSKNGIFGSDLDIGYYDFSIVEDGHRPALVGKDDGEVLPQEVYRYVLNNYAKYKNLLAEKTIRHYGTKVYYPFALPKASRRTDRQKLYYKNLESLVASANRMLADNGIKKGDSRYGELMYASLRIALGDDSLRKHLSDAGLEKLIEPLRRFGDRIDSGSVACKSVLPLNEHINMGCEGNAISKYHSLYLALHIAGLHPGLVLAKMRGELPSIEMSMKYGDDDIVPFSQEKVEWLFNSPRIELAALYLSIVKFAMSQNVVEPDADLVSSWVIGAKLLMPESVNTQYIYGLWLLERDDSDPSAAYEEFKAALEGCPSNATEMKHSLKLHIGKALVGQERYEEAVPIFEQLLDMEIDDDIRNTALGELGRCFGELGRHEDALEAFRKAIELEPFKPFHHLGLSKTYASLGDYDRAIEAAKVAIGLQPENMWMRRRLFFLYARGKNDWDGARSVLKDAIEINPTDPDTLFIKAHAYVYDEEWDKALECIQQAITKEAADPDYRMIEGLIYIGMKDLQSAVESFRSAIEHNPDCMYAGYYLAMLDVARGNYADALRVFEKIDMELLDVSVRYPAEIYYGYALLMMGNHEESAEHLFEALKYRGEVSLTAEADIIHHLLLFDALTDFDLQRAKEELIWLRENAKGSVHHYLAETQMAYSNGNLRKAAMFAEKANGVEKTAYAYNMIGISKLKDGLNEEAERAFEEAKRYVGGTVLPSSLELQESLSLDDKPGSPDVPPSDPEPGDSWNDDSRSVEKSISWHIDLRKTVEEKGGRFLGWGPNGMPMYKMKLVKFTFTESGSLKFEDIADVKSIPGGVSFDTFGIKMQRDREKLKVGKMVSPYMERIRTEGAPKR